MLIKVNQEEDVVKGGIGKEQYWRKPLMFLIDKLSDCNKLLQQFATVSFY
jgi:hypothetical protein